MRAGPALAAAPAVLNLDREGFEVRVTHQAFKTKTQSIRIDSREFANPHANFVDMAARKPARLRADGIKH
jgi:hypothetical protein